MRRWLPIALALFVLPQVSRALIVFDTKSSVDNTFNTTAPSSGAPWDHVAEFFANGNPDASGVYLGGGYILTANHVYLDGNSSIHLNGSTYTLDWSFTPTRIGTADIKIIKILGDPGLAQLPLISDTDVDLSKSSTIIACGEAKGSVVTNQGWTWGAGTSAERWGTNTTLNTTTTSNGTEYLITSFDANQGSNEAAMALGDSGGGLFLSINGTWKLAGIASAVSTSGTSFYDNNSSQGGNQPDYNYFVRIQTYNDMIALVIPEPSTMAGVLLGGAFLGLRRRRRP